MAFQAKTIKIVTASLLISLFSFGGPSGFFSDAQALSTPPPGTSAANSVSSCSTKYKLAFQYSKTNKSQFSAAMLGWRRGTQTVLSNEASMLLEWKRGTPTVRAILGGAQTALDRFLLANPSANVETELLVIDDQFDTQTAVNAANEVVADGCVLGVIGPSSSHIAKHVIPIYSAAGIPMISPSAIDPSVANTVGGTFHRIVLPEDPNDLRTLNTLKAMGVTRPTIFEDDGTNPDLLSRWARTPNVLVESILEWKRGTPTVTSRTEIIKRVQDAGTDGYLFNGYGGYEEFPSNPSNSAFFAGQFKEFCPSCKPLIYGENSGILFMDEKWISAGNVGFESITVLSNSMPMQFHSTTYQEYFDYFGSTQYLAEAYDATKFLLAGIAAGNVTRNNLNNFINTKKFNGLSGPISFESNGELSGRSQLRFSVVNQQISIVSGLPSGYIPNEQISSFTPPNPTLTEVIIKVTDFNDSATTSFIDVNTTYSNYRVARLADSTTALSLPNGISTITISPNSPTLKARDRQEIGIRRSQFEITILNGSVSSIKNLKDNSALSATAGIYNLKLPAPTAIMKIGGATNFAGVQLIVQPYITPALNEVREGDSGYFNSNNEVYLTYLPKFKYDYSVAFRDPELWQNSGYVNGEFTASSLISDPIIISITPPTSAVTGQLAGTYGPESKIYLESYENRWRVYETTRISIDGYFGFSAVKNYPLRIRVVSVVDGKQVSFTQTESFTLTTDSPTRLNLSVPMPTLNVSGQATLEGLGQAGISFDVLGTSTTGWKRVLTSRTDSSGNFSLGLPPDKYQLVFQQTEHRNFSRTQIECVVFADVSHTCNVALGPPTLVVAISGVPGLTKAFATLYSDYGGGKWIVNKMGYNTPINNENKFSFFVSPGTYRTQFSIWSNGRNYTVFGPKCVVVLGVKTNCEAAFPSERFNFKIKTLSGTPYVGTASLNFSLMTTNEQVPGRQTSIYASLSDSFSVPLLNGDYKLRINPNTDSTTIGVSQQFTFSISNGEVSNLIAIDSSTTITATEGLFSLSLGRPQLAGRVVGTDGISPLSNMRIYYGIPGVKENSGPITNANGNFVFNLENKIPDGAISIWALDAYSKNPDSSGISAGTAIESVTIVNGSGPTDVLLRAKNPNLVGTVLGPNGASKRNYLRLLTLQSGKWIYNGRTMRSSDSGQFGIHLPVGSYRIQTYSDKTAGGLETLGPICEVISDSPTVCNISMDVPNVTGAVSISGRTSSFWFLHFTKIDEKFSSHNGITDWGGNNQFAAKLDPGTYRASLGLYVYGENGYFQMMNLFGDECLVPDSGSVVCNVAAPSPNLKFNVRSSSGEVLTSSYLYLLQVKSGVDYVGYNNISSSVLQKTQAGLGGTFESSLLDGSYRLTLTPQSNVTSGGVTQTYIFDVSNSVVTNMRIEGTTSIINASNGTFTLRLRSPALAGRVVTADGATGAANVRVEALLGKNLFSAYTDSNGYFGFSFGAANIDGSYVVRARVNEGDNLRSDSLETTTTVSGGLGPVNLVLNLRTPNVSGTVSGPLGVSVNTWVFAKKLTQNGGWEAVSNPYRYTTSEGKFGYNLDPGTYQFDVQGDLERTGGTSTTSANCVVSAGQNKICDISLPAPNMTGVLKIGGVITQGSLGFFKEVSDAKSNYYASIGKATSTNSLGYFGLSMSPGTYRSQIYVWAKNSFYFGPTCVVPDSGSVTCDIDLPVTNLRVQIASSSGVAQTSGTAILISANFNGFRFDGNWVNAQTAQLGIFDLNLIDGNYTITAYPGSNQKLGKPQVFNVIVESATVTSIKQFGATSNLTPTSGVYTLTLASSPIEGTVVAPDGTTPTPYSQVDLFNLEKLCAYCQIAGVQSDQSGYFGFEKVLDGQYQLIARQPYADPTKADSLPISITVSGGMGSSSIVIPLRTPNVTGVVRGPLGVSAGNWIQVLRVTENNGRSNPATTVSVVTDAQGNFSFNLEPGNYLFYAQQDLKSAGGIAGTSDLCVVPASGNVSCDINLKSANFKIKIVNAENAILEGSWAYVYYAEKDDSALKNRNPGFSYSSSGIGEIFLEDGTWILQAEPPYSNSLYSRSTLTVKVIGGLVTEVKDANGEALTVSSGFYSITLPGVNLKGVISFNGETYTSSSYVQLKRFNGKNYENTDGRWVYSGVFGFKVTPGTYQIEVRPYSNSNTGPVVTYLSDCVVASSGVSTCSVALSSGNLSGRITNELGETYRFSYANIWKMVNGEYGDNQWVEVNSGVFRVNLADGTYRLRIEPYWEYRASYTSREYEVTVVSNVVTQVKDIWSNQFVTATSGIYPFALGTPSARGKVLEPGTSTVGVRDVSVLVAPAGEENRWIYSTNTDALGNFALTIPDGTYVIRAVPYGTGFQYGKSEAQTITVSGGVASGTITLRLRNPNLTGRIVTPGSSPVPLANVNVNIMIENEYFYTWTDSSGQFGVFVDQVTPDCPDKCSVMLNYYKSSDYTFKRYEINSIGDIGDKAIGGVTSRVTVVVPQSGTLTLPNQYGFVGVESIDTVTNQSTWVSGGHTDESGKVGLNLETGLKYRLTFYPGYQVVGQFAPKVVNIESFSPVLNESMTVTFDKPNLQLKVSSHAGIANMYGWYEVRKLNTSNNAYEFYSNNYLNQLGEGAVVLPDGEFTIRFWPGKTSGVEREISVTVSSGVVSGAEVSSGTANVVLPTGNISGYVRNQSDVLLKEIIVTAVRDSDTTKTISTITDQTGYYELNLDRTHSWTIKAIEVTSAAFSSVSIATATPSNSALSNQNIVITIP